MARSGVGHDGGGARGRYAVQVRDDLGRVVVRGPWLRERLGGPHQLGGLRGPGTGLYRIRTRCRGCDLRFGQMNRVGQDRGLCLVASSI